jgi:hypothetical protein
MTGVSSYWMSVCGAVGSKEVDSSSIVQIIVSRVGNGVNRKK